ncbi:hypothetical protein ACSBOB_07735 [Mesorhizobium sp. ASY16-5R]|uniref:hypothetical protein n=1 Tax=Mesorhizobium sp. ASY16-5R TaxID=3445772 RepID=UPI003FA08D1C
MSHATVSPAILRPAPTDRTAPYLVWLAVSVLLSFLWSMGHYANGDVDDLLKAHEVRFLLESGNIFDRTLPGILQPEVFVSHWPWIVDLPYAAVAFILRPVVGLDAALSAAFFCVPLMLLAGILFFMRKVIATFDFASPTLVLVVSTIVALRALGEFEPGRIDYHNLQMLLLVAILFLTIQSGRRAAFASGVLTALALAAGVELALFLVLVLAIRAFDFVLGNDDAKVQTQAFGLSLAGTAVILFFAITAPDNYARPLCDRYSSPLAAALVMAGASFAILPTLIRKAGVVPRLLSFAACGLASAAVLALLFPGCLAGPYAGLSDYLRIHWLDRIYQEGSLFDHRDFVVSEQLFYFTIQLVGALGAVVAAVVARGRDRAWLVLALFSAVAVAHTVLYFRYLRFMPLFAGPGLAYVLHSVLPANLARGFAGRVDVPKMRVLPLLPGLLLPLGLLGYHLATTPQEITLEGVDVADNCMLEDLEPYAWPAGGRILAPPLIGIRLISNPGATVVAIPFHTGTTGIERSLRFFDPATADPSAVAASAEATLVATCAWRGKPLRKAEQEFPLAAGLIQGKPPAWLAECPLPADATLRVYRLATQPADACPTMLPRT